MLTPQNRHDFLEEIARQLGRPLRREPPAPPPPVSDFAASRLTELTQEERCTAFSDYARDVLKVNCCRVSEDQLIPAVLALCEEYGRSPVIVSGDLRLQALGVTQALQQQLGATVWQPDAGAENLTRAEQAQVGVVYAEAGLTESGSVVLFSAPDRGRAVSLLPTASIFVLRKSTILPRVAQLAQQLHQRAQRGERMPSCINLIAGPSSTADIELIKVVGVHGPVHAAYVIIEDC
ncbi:lactate utilization protein C [Chimaeribacter arupi]|uniref:Lactate utilization protein C n=2 Tax=Yersiniaceae TaxID=1903411 RepID=A0A2N5EN46_9GAMM|nr:MULTISPECIES: lactate utilization protein C [Yersiniaceae]MBS0971271.1 lactate utilization protein C [Nissabacter archeti]MDV5141303.1 lactate utilization protein C [Chimaeribacter arupi]PLR35768.1 lactate utilization protein C [Chimaeribacter arupi]PLR47192.1 lactate utilization protein C [Chimaeribacter arupi]PLR49875.1 lactate utilization protein C [Chimaeribacter arupi]